MKRATILQHEQKVSLSQEAWPHRVRDDPRWKLAQRVVAGTHLARSPLLSKFLLFVVAETLEGRGREITEHQIGMQVFDRQPSYRTVEDNIVRNYARQLRKRLAVHFAGEGSSEALRIDIPVGGYVPVFVPVSGTCDTSKPERAPAPIGIRAQAPHDQPQLQDAAVPARRNRKHWLLRELLLFTYSAILICFTWLAASRFHAAPHTSGPAGPLWAALFDGPANSYIVPADAGFNLLEDLSRQPLPLADYIKSSYLELPLPGVDAHSAEDLRSQQFTSFVDFKIVAALAGLPEYNQRRTLLRFPRDLQLDDLKSVNAVLIGSVGSNPWGAIAERGANFRIVYRQGMQGAAVININPRSGEAASYASRWNEPAHDTFALIAFLPNLDGNGHLLFLQGLDVAGTQAAAEALLHPAAIAPILRQATRSDGSLRSFEILLRSTSIDSNSAGAELVASRVY
jgi:hypothetical protein